MEKPNFAGFKDWEKILSNKGVKNIRKSLTNRFDFIKIQNNGEFTT